MTAGKQSFSWFERLVIGAGYVVAFGIFGGVVVVVGLLEGMTR